MGDYYQRQRGGGGGGQGGGWKRCREEEQPLSSINVLLSTFIYLGDETLHQVGVGKRPDTGGASAAAGAASAAEP